jgi:hypothetical protein
VVVGGQSVIWQYDQSTENSAESSAVQISVWCTDYRIIAAVVCKHIKQCRFFLTNWTDNEEENRDDKDMAQRSGIDRLHRKVIKHEGVQRVRSVYLCVAAYTGPLHSSSGPHHS